MRRTPLSREWAERGMAPSWLAINGNKRSLTLDLQKPAAIEIISRLVSRADVVMDSFRPGVLDGLGIGYQAQCAINLTLICYTISRYGATVPHLNQSGHDGKIRATSVML